MIDKDFKQFVSKNNLFKKEDKLLLALSGGCDSVALFHLLKDSGYNFSAAHCNFKLREQDSEEDEKFVFNLCRKYNIQLFVKSFDTKKYASENKLSIEDAARKLRYAWFEKIRSENNFDYIITAHHLNDKIETFFINLAKGTGIKGLRSISAKNKKIIRPLLFANRNEIEEYCRKNKITHRTDKSNFDTYFLRNKIRHEILPIFSEINPKFLQSMAKNFRIFSDIENIYSEYIKNKVKEIVKIHNTLHYISLDKLLKTSAPFTLLYEIIRLYGFKSAQNELIFNSLNTLQTGKIFYSETHRLLKTKDYLIIDTKNKIQSEDILIYKDLDNKNCPELSFSISEKIPGNLKTDSNTALLDFDKLKFPLIIRHYKKGDYFFPFGMNGKKLLSDYFTDKKINLFEREKIKIITTSDNKIVWITGQRIDNRFKISKNTKKILQIRKN